MKLINADEVIKTLRARKNLFCRNRIEFCTLSTDQKARVDEIDTCIAELVNAEEVQTTDTDSDTISRQSVIDAYGDWYVEEGTEDGFIGTVKQLLEGFPSAQLGTNLAEVGTDCISRQAAIEAIDSFNVFESRCDQIKLEQMIGELPPAQPERIVHCKDCEWWTKQECSPQGRCALSGMYPTGGWFCGNARMREVTT